MRRPLQLGLAVVIGILVGASIQCGDAGVLSSVCVRDSDCALDWASTDCQRACVREEARTKAQLEIIQDQRAGHCADKEIRRSSSPAREACDWNRRYRAVCRVGTCVAEPIEGGAEPLFRAPEIPSKLTSDDPHCRVCSRSRDQACVAEVVWECDDERACEMLAECDAECCDEVASIEVSLDAAPWGAWVAARKKPATGLLVFASSSLGTVENRLGFVELPARSVVITEIALLSYEPVVTWVDGSSDFLVATYKTIERVSFPSRAQRKVLASFSVSGLDVAPAGDAVLVSWLGHPGYWRLMSFPLGQAEPVALPVTWSANDDTNPRWSPDGKRIALEKSGREGRVAVVDAATGRFEGRHTTDRFVGPTWHPSGEFLLMWLVDETDYDKPHCDMVVVTPDRSRYARLGIVTNIRRCPAIAVTPDGAHVASWVTRDGPTRIEWFALGSSQPDQLSAYGHPSVLEWVPLQLSALGLTESPPPPPEPLK